MHGIRGHTEKEGVRHEGDGKDRAPEAWAVSSLASDDMEVVLGMPGQDDETEEAWMIRSYRRRIEQEIVL